MLGLGRELKRKLVLAFRGLTFQAGHRVGSMGAGEQSGTEGQRGRVLQPEQRVGEGCPRERPNKGWRRPSPGILRTLGIRFSALEAA